MEDRGIDWTGPMPDNDDDSEIHVPDTCCPLSAWSFDMLCQQIDPLASCNDYAIEFYLSCCRFVQSHSV